METREPNKGQGVPKETRSHNSIAALHSTLTGHIPELSKEGLHAELERRGFFEAGMQRQVRIMAEAAVGVWAGQDSVGLITALSSSPFEKIRGVAALVLSVVHANDLVNQVRGLRVVGALPGTWPRELSATVLHNLVIQHGAGTVLPLVQDWIEDPAPAVRRLAVESFRPRGVMLAHIAELKRDPTPLRAILEPLLDDEADYVRKAVANNLNDVSKDNPEILLGWAQEWMTHKPSNARQWILSRALRTLVNEGRPTALEILGYAPASILTADWKHGTPQSVEINQLIPFEFEVFNPSESEALILLLLFIDEPGKGKARRRSRYQIWKGRVEAGASKSISKRIHFVDRRSQPKEPGTYRLTVTLNGEILEERVFVFER